MQRLFAIAGLTWKAAFRFRLFLVLAVWLLAAVVGLPLLIKDDGTARGFTQVLLTYTLSVITALLGWSTLWLSCGTLARDIEECQMQVVAVKPIARWQIWLGKWLGLMLLNAALLALAGGSVYALLQWRATRLPPDQQGILRNEVLVSRGTARPASVAKFIEEETDRQTRDQLKKSGIAVADLSLLRQQIKEQIKADFQIVPPATHSSPYRAWKIDLGLAKRYLRDQPLFLRVKFNTALTETGNTATCGALWQVGVPETPRVWRSEWMSLAAETFHEFQIPANLFDDNGVLTVFFINPNDVALLFPLEDGVEVLFRQGGFGLNFVRGLGIIWCWMALLAALGLAAASFLSFPVAAFLSLAILTIYFSSGTMSEVVEMGSVLGVSHEGGVNRLPIDALFVRAFKSLLWLGNQVKQFSPIDALSVGRSISWQQLGLAFGLIVVLFGGIVGSIGAAIFSRRELATAQGTQ